MKKKTITINVPDDVANFVQRVDVELASRKYIIAYLLSHANLEDIDNQRFHQYQEEYFNNFYIFEIIKDEIFKKYIFPVVKNKKATWELSYQNHEIYVSVPEEN